MERREALGRLRGALGQPCDRPAARRAKAYRHLAIGALASWRSTAAFIGSEPKPKAARERGYEPRAQATASCPAIANVSRRRLSRSRICPTSTPLTGRTRKHASSVRTGRGEYKCAKVSGDKPSPRSPFKYLRVFRFSHTRRVGKKFSSWPGLSRPSTPCFAEENKKEDRRGCPRQVQA